MSTNMTMTWFCGLLLLALHFCEGAPASSWSSWLNALGGNATEATSKWFKELGPSATESASWLKDYGGNATEATSKWFKKLGPSATESASWLKEYGGNATEATANWFKAVGHNATESASWLKEFGANETEATAHWFKLLGHNASESASWLKEYAVNATESVEDVVSHLPWICIGYIIGCAAGGVLFFALGLHWLLLCLGFGALGPVAGSIAALCQPAAGVSFAFSCMQSTGMTFLACWSGQFAFTMTAWFIMIPLFLLGGGGAGYAGYVFLPVCQNCTMNGTISHTLNDTIVVNNITEVYHFM